MKRKGTLPKANIEYVFKIPETGNICHLAFECELPNGRLKFTNITYNSYLDMTKARFSYLHSKHLKEKRPYSAPAPEVKKSASAPAVVKGPADVPEETTLKKKRGMSFSECIDETCEDLKNLSEDEKRIFEELSNKTVEFCVRALQTYKGSNPFTLAGSSSDILIEVDDILKKLKAKIA